MKHLQRWWILFVILTVMALAPAVLADAPTGAGPNDPLMVTGTWLPLAPNASAWYYFDNAADKSRVEVDLDTNGVGNIQLAIYTPALARAWLQDPTTKPVGIGTKPGAQTAAAIHDLVWLGAFNSAGRYFAVVTNNNAAQVSYRLLISGTSVTLAPPPTPTPYPTPLFATPIPTGTIQGRLLFQEASGGNIDTVNGDGTNLTRVTSGLDPAWSPDGKMIAFTRWNYPGGVFVANADGSNEQALMGTPKALSPQWSPDGSKIVFTRQDGGTTADKQFCFFKNCITLLANPHWKLGVLDASSGALSEPKSSDHAFSPTWDSDNTTITYADATFGILNTDTQGDAPITIFNQNPDVQSTLLSPDGSQIAFMVRQHDHWEINVVNADGSNPVAVTQANPLAFNVVNNVAPTWSPDGKQILFLSDRGGKWEFFVVNVDGTGLTQVLKNVTDSITIGYNFSNERMIDWTQ